MQVVISKYNPILLFSTTSIAVIKMSTFYPLGLDQEAFEGKGDINPLIPLDATLSAMDLLRHDPVILMANSR